MRPLQGPRSSRAGGPATPRPATRLGHERWLHAGSLGCPGGVLHAPPRGFLIGADLPRPEGAPRSYGRCHLLCKRNARPATWPKGARPPPSWSRNSPLPAAPKSNIPNVGGLDSWDRIGFVQVWVSGGARSRPRGLDFDPTPSGGPSPGPDTVRASTGHRVSKKLLSPGSERAGTNLSRSAQIRFRVTSVPLESVYATASATISPAGYGELDTCSAN